MRLSFAALSLGLSVACGSAPAPAPVADHIDLDGVLAVWAETLGALDRATPGEAAEPAPALPSSVRDSTLLATTRATLNRSADRVHWGALLAVEFSADGALLAREDLDGDAEPEDGEPHVFAIAWDPRGRRWLAVDATHTDRVRELPLPPGEVGLATAYAVGRMHGAQLSAGVGADRWDGLELQAPGYHAQIDGARRYAVQSTEGARPAPPAP